MVALSADRLDWIAGILGGSFHARHGNCAGQSAEDSCVDAVDGRNRRADINGCGMAPLPRHHQPVCAAQRRRREVTGAGSTDAR